MARATVYRMFEVREGFVPNDIGPLRFESESRGEADRALEELSLEGSSVQLFGIKVRDDGDEGERVLLRTFMGQRAA